MIRLKFGAEQAKLNQGYQALISVVSAALGGSKSSGSSAPPGTMVPQNMDQMRAAMRAVLGAGSVG